MGSIFDIDQRNALIAQLKAFRARSEVVRASKILRTLILVGVICYLILKLSDVGWGDVANALPASPWFYIFFALRFIALPISEMYIYERIWGISLTKHFPAFVRKRVYNFAVMGYSGEGFLTLWARRTLPLKSEKILIGVKDNNLLSALTSNLATVFIVIFLLLAGELMRGINALPPGSIVLFVVAFLTALSLSVSVILFRRKLIALTDDQMGPLMIIHIARIVLILGLHAGMYSAALPGAPLMTWMMFLALQLVLSRIPFIPNQDLVFLGAALSLSSFVGTSEAVLAGMLLAEAGLSQIVNFSLFFATAYLARSKTT